MTSSCSNSIRFCSALYTTERSCQSRASLLAETKIGSVKGTGYYEADFLGAGTTSNNRQTNSYVFRQRQVWAQAAFDNGNDAGTAVDRAPRLAAEGRRAGR